MKTAKIAEYQAEVRRLAALMKHSHTCGCGAVVWCAGVRRLNGRRELIEPCPREGRCADCHKRDMERWQKWVAKGPEFYDTIFKRDDK